MHFLTSNFQQSWKNVSMLYQWESLCKALMDAISGHIHPSHPITLTPGHAAIPRPLPVHMVGCAVPGQGSSWQPQVPVFWSHESSRVWGRATTGRGWKWHQLLWLLPTPGLSFLFFLNYWHFWWLKMEMQKLCPDFWVNIRLDTTQHNAGSNCWLQFAMVSSIKPFQDFTTNWPQLRK